MPECGNIEIKYDPSAKDGFCLGLMQDFGLDISDAKEPDLDDILYIDIDEKGGISSFVSIGLPMRTPLALAFAIPDFTRSRIIPSSSSANKPDI